MPSRHDFYSQLLRDEDHWQKTVAIISCKILREPHNEEAFNQIAELLASDLFQKLVVRHDWHLVFTGGTYKRLKNMLRRIPELKKRSFPLAPSALGVIQIANLVVYGQLLAVLFFNDMEDFYADSPQNLCLRRICNNCNTPLLEDYTSIEYMLHHWFEEDAHLPRRKGKYKAVKVQEYFGPDGAEDNVLYADDLGPRDRANRGRETLAIVSHNERKMTMLNFCLQHMKEILSYHRVISTGTTGDRLISQYKSALTVLKDECGDEAFSEWQSKPAKGQSVDDFLVRKIQPFRSGPEGGDIQISAKVIDGTCHRVLFFQDPKTAHPHQFDIRLMEKAVQDQETAALFATSVETAEILV